MNEQELEQALEDEEDPELRKRLRRKLGRLRRGGSETIPSRYGQEEVEQARERLLSEFETLGIKHKVPQSRDRAFYLMPLSASAAQLVEKFKARWHVAPRAYCFWQLPGKRTGVLLGPLPNAKG